MSNDSMMSIAGVTGTIAPTERAVRTGTAGEAQEPLVKKIPTPQTRQGAADLESVAQRIDSYMRSVNRSLEFRVDEASGRTVVTVREAASGDVIRQIPSEEVLRLAQMAEDQTIVLVNEKI